MPIPLIVIALSAAGAGGAGFMVLKKSHTVVPITSTAPIPITHVAIPIPAKPPTQNRPAVPAKVIIAPKVSPSRPAPPLPPKYGPVMAKAMVSVNIPTVQKLASQLGAAGYIKQAAQLQQHVNTQINNTAKDAQQAFQTAKTVVNTAKAVIDAAPAAVEAVKGIADGIGGLFSSGSSVDASASIDFDAGG
jgi:hypothetical protein